jgi:hypothetical protein
MKATQFFGLEPTPGNRPITLTTVIVWLGLLAYLGNVVWTAMGW